MNGNILAVDTGGPAYGQEPDARTFVYAGGKDGSYYFKDKNYAYFTNWQEFAGMPNADPVTFSTNSDILPFAKDQTHVFLGREVVTNADPSTFVVVDSQYTHDAKNVYWFGYNGGPLISKLINGADVATFSVVSGQSSYDAQDKNHKYLQGQIVQ